MPHAPLTEQLHAEFGGLLPSSLIDRTVAAVTAPDPTSLARTARTDLAALADAVVRSGSREPVR